MFKVFIKSRAEREFTKLSSDLKQEFYQEFKKLARDPFRHSHTRKIRGTDRGYRLRVGRWRILFTLFSKQKRIEIVDIFLKKGKENYRKRLK